jgi:hypothetical protein
MIDDEREVAMLLPPGHLVNPDLEELVETVRIQVLVTHPLDDPPDRPPVDPEHARYRRRICPG